MGAMGSKIGSPDTPGQSPQVSHATPSKWKHSSQQQNKKIIIQHIPDITSPSSARNLTK